MNLNIVECPADDISRGAYLSSKGYINIYEPFDFSGKLGIRDMDG